MDPNHIATAADGTGNEVKSDSKDSDNGTPTVTDGITKSGAASLLAPSVMIGLTVLAMAFL